MHTTLSPENEPSFGWLRKVYSLFDRRLKENLYLMYVVHASWWLKNDELPHLRDGRDASRARGPRADHLSSAPSRRRVLGRQAHPARHLADLFKRNYFAPGALRMPDSPLVRKYLELSNDLALFDSIAPPQATDGRVDALAEALRSGAVPGGAMLKPGAGAGERAAVAMAVAERDGAGGAAERQLVQAQARAPPPSPPAPPPPPLPLFPSPSRPSPPLPLIPQASKEILLKQLIELSDQLARAQSDGDAAQRRAHAVQVCGRSSQPSMLTPSLTSPPPRPRRPGREGP